MLHKVIKVDIPTDVFTALNETEVEIENDLKLFSAIRYYQMGKLTIGKAAILVGISRYEFERILADNHIPISNLEIEDIEGDIQRLGKI
ncbi:MAG: UPF0175 family protein [Nitrospirae bacterium]|uniref:UPF0175 family protein n=1 Tax=Candidatus Magnetobacterium casense TaxID=1455061 RepID=UPI00058D12DC|nr:UPF0175 family protein [Candidatus Magnetobacterium casensis]MBF0339218.1 UPF0175 family protein [Nitrospirota bacterium]